MEQPNGATLNIDLDELFKDDPEAGTPPVNKEKQVELTKIMTDRINDVRTKTEATVRDSVAKDLGFESYDAMQKAKDKKLITEAGYNPDDLEKLIGPMLEKRLASDPRMQRLQQLEDQDKKAYTIAQLAEIEKLTGLKVKETDLSQETLDLMGKGVPLAKAYIATNSVKIISSKGSTDHLVTGASTGSVKTRNLTQSEKDFYKSINSYATDEELSKKTIEVK